MAKITPLSLFVINRVKLRRLVLGIRGARLSNFLKHTEAYVFNAEKDDLEAQYPPHEYPSLAAALNWTIKDLLPPDDAAVSDGTKVEKKVLSLSNPDDMRLVVEGLTEYGFFDKPKSLTDVAKHLYIGGKPEEKVLEQVLKIIVDIEKLNIKKGSYQSV